MKKILVFGTGYYAEKKWQDVAKLYQIVAACDNKVKAGEYQLFNNIKVYNPQDCPYFKDYPVLIMIKDYISVVKQLKSIGVATKNIWILMVNTPYEDIKYVTCEEIDRVISLPSSVIGDDWGYRRGTPIGRVYISKFLEKYKRHIRGDIMEVGETTYSKHFCIKDETNSYTAIHVDGIDGCRKANLETGDGLAENEFDTMIITQTLAYIYDLEATVQNIYRSLKKDGYCMITVTDIGHMGMLESERYGCYWGFHKKGINRLFSDVFGDENVCVEVYGNVKTVTAQLYGLAAEDIDDEFLDFNDVRYPMIIGVVAHKVD